jgi:hypothetical protein
MSMRQGYLNRLRDFPEKYQHFHDVRYYDINELSNRQLEKFFIQDAECRRLLDKDLGIRRDDFRKRKRDFSIKKK